MRTFSYKHNELKIYGVNACLAVFKSRPADIVKVYLAEKRLKLFSDLVRWCVKNRKGYDVVDERALEKLTESTHHEGVCLVVKEKAQLSFEDFVGRISRIGPISPIVYLDGVQNPHNVGNILRACAHFGVTYVFVSDVNFATLPASARRVSEGGAETVSVIHLKQPVQDLQRLKKMGFTIYGTSSHCSRSLFVEKLISQCVFVMGGEIEGMTPGIQKLCDQNLLIPGTGAVESLNVASACAIFLAKYYE